MAGKVAGALGAGRGFEADQGEVWEEVAHRIQFSRADSETSSYADYVGTRASELGELERAFHPVPNQVGFAASIGDEIAGLELIGRPESFARAFRGLLGGYLIDAVDAGFLRDRADGVKPARRRRVRVGGDTGDFDDVWPPNFEQPSPFDAPEVFLEALAGAPVTVSPSLDLGEDLRLEGESGCGAAPWPPARSYT